MIPISDSVIDLGLTITKDLSWDSNANVISSKVFAGLRSLWPHQRNLPVKTRINLVKALLIPHFCYCSIVFAKMSGAADRTLLRAFNACVRFVAGLKKYESTSEHQNEILGCGLLQYLDYRTCLFMFTLLQTGHPEYLMEHIQRGVSVRTCRLVIPRNKTMGMNSSFFVNGVRVWNSLPVEIRNQQTIMSFKKACKNHFSVT